MNGLMALLVLRRRRWLRERQASRNRLRNIRDTSDPFSVSDDIFKGMYCLNKEMARALVEELRPHMVKGRRISAIPIEFKVLCALHFLRRGSHQKSLGSNSNLGLSQSSVSTVIGEVTAALNSPEILVKWIKFPRTPGERSRLIKKNYLLSQFPGVIGYVGGTHVAIKTPNEDEHAFLNRELNHSINVMIVCDSELNILNCLAKFGGSCCDSYVWNMSAVKGLLMEVWTSGEQCWLLGDSGYPHQPWLQTPILNAPDGSPEANYTAMHIRARSAVERCIGLLKGRFRCLLMQPALEYSPIKAGRIVNSCVVLHNMCLQGGLRDGYVLPEEPGECHLLPEQLSAQKLPQLTLLQEARAVRQRIVNHLHH